MSEIRKPHGNEPEPERPWFETAKAYYTFAPGIDEIFERHFDEVDR